MWNRSELSQTVSLALLTLLLAAGASCSATPDIAAASRSRSLLADDMGGLAGGDAGGLFSSLTDLLQRSASNPTYVDASVSTETSGQLFARLFSGDGIVAQRSGVMDQLAAAIEESRTLLASNHWDDLFGGMELGQFVSSDQGVLQSMLAAAEEVESHYCKPPHIEYGEEKPTACVGHNVTLSIQGGHCTIRHDHSVLCSPPRVVLISTPAVCTMKHSTPLRVVGNECKVEKAFGEAHAGFLLHPIRKTHSASVEDVLERMGTTSGEIVEGSRLVEGAATLWERLQGAIRTLGQRLGS